ncbi:hypothetical protein TNCV_3582031 [Trichonephila clavipes]|nr:hypothetical protein TNCV_3582031 [Trichonephila clavipes]
MSWLLYQLVYNPACLVAPGGAWMGSCIAERGLSRGHYWLLNLGLALPNWSSENHKEFSSSFLKKKIKISQNKDKTKNASIKTPNPLDPTHAAQPMASLNPSPGEGLMLPNLNVDQLSLTTRFLIISLPSNAMSSISPFVIQKALIGIGGEPNSVKILRSGYLPIETLSAIQTKSFLQAKTFLNSPVNIYPHKT